MDVTIHITRAVIFEEGDVTSVDLIQYLHLHLVFQETERVPES